jgi:hypothetical protein
MGRRPKVARCDLHRRPTAMAVAVVELDVDGDRWQARLCAEHYASFRDVLVPWWPPGTEAEGR